MKRSLYGAAAIFGAATLAAGIASHAAIDTALFPYSGGWLGADAAYSIPLDRFSTVWLFGDTFVGQKRQAAGMIHNSIAIRKCRDGCQTTYWWSGMRTTKPDSFFKTPDSNYYWPLDGFTYRGKLYIFLEQMHETGGGGAFGFNYSSIKLVTIANPNDEPSHWLFSYRTVSTGDQVVPGIATATGDDAGRNFLYVFTLFRRTAPQPFVGLMRAALEGFSSTDTKIRWQYLTAESRWLDWVPSTSPHDASRLLGGNITEMSVKYHPERQEWIALFPTPGFLSNTASCSRSRRLSGPWTDPNPFFSYPEMKKTSPRYTPNVFCYAAKEHPELEGTGQIAFTYACNSVKESEIFRDLQLYRPELVSEELPGRQRQNSKLAP